jgi:hypothetical protein
VNFYNILADGYHTPLTKTQISELLKAGRLSRNQPCKQVEKKEWRTIDELFPLLKYDASGPSFHQPTALPSSQDRNRALAIVISLLVISTASFTFYFALRSETYAFRDATAVEVAAAPRTRVAVSSPPANSAILNITSSANVPRSDDSARQARLAQERLNVVQRREELSQAAKLAQDRAEAARRELAQQKAAGKNEVIPLDDIFIPDVGGSGVTVKIHDNDVTSFDVWINGDWRRKVIKQKGITGSRTDETLIYQNGRARLYYVWEISGKLNCCLLRVRYE